jgi:hypothetical protein
MLRQAVQFMPPMVRRTVFVFALIATPSLQHLYFYVISVANYFVELMWFCSSSAWQIGLSCGNQKN